LEPLKPKKVIQPFKCEGRCSDEKSSLEKKIMERERKREHLHSKLMKNLENGFMN